MGFIHQKYSQIYTCWLYYTQNHLTKVKLCVFFVCVVVVKFLLPLSPRIIWLYFDKEPSSVKGRSICDQEHFTYTADRELEHKESDWRHRMLNWSWQYTGTDHC